MKQMYRGWRAGWRRGVPVALAGLMLSGPGQAQVGRVALHEMDSPSLLRQALQAETRRLVRELASLTAQDIGAEPEDIRDVTRAGAETTADAQAETKADTKEDAKADTKEDTKTDTKEDTKTDTKADSDADTPPDVLYPPPVVTPQTDSAAVTQETATKETAATAETAATKETATKDTADTTDKDTAAKGAAQDAVVVTAPEDTGPVKGAQDVPAVTADVKPAADAQQTEVSRTTENNDAKPADITETAEVKDADTKGADTKDADTKDAATTVPATALTPATAGDDSEETARLREQITSLTVQHDVLAERLAQLQAQMMPGMPAPTLNRAPEGDQAQLGYAAGVMYARMIQGLVAEDRLASLTQDERALQAGLSDAMAGRPLLMTPEALDRALAQVKAAAEQARTPAPAVEREKEQVWVAAFRQEPGAKTDESGYDYRVTHEGDGAWLTDEDVVDVVVEETLTDGTVVSDMDATGSQVRQPVKAFPPVFASALKKLRNHGQITLVVPPALAYGERGYPPLVPPGATVVYRVRVQDVTVTQTAKPAKTDAKAKAAAKPQAKTKPAEKKPAAQKPKKTQEQR